MTLGQIKERLQSSEYDFLRTDEHLGHHIILLTLGGSHAYGTSMETSDLDIRGCALNSKREILIHEEFWAGNGSAHRYHYLCIPQADSPADQL